VTLRLGVRNDLFSDESDIVYVNQQPRSNKWSDAQK